MSQRRVRAERSTKSIHALEQLLRRISESPAEFSKDSTLCRSLKAQGALAKYGDEARGIEQTSINTLKRLADAKLSGGWPALDRLRLSALEALLTYHERDRRSNVTTRSGLLSRVTEQDKELEFLRQTNLCLLSVVKKVASDMVEVASVLDSQARKALAEESTKRLRASLSLNKPPFDKLPDHHSSP